VATYRVSGGSSYLDSLVLTQRDLNTTWGSAADSDAEAWHYPLTNWRNDTVRVEGDVGGILAGYRYSAYGSRSNTLAADFNQDGFVDFFDQDDFLTCYEGNGCPSGTTADWNGDGTVDFFDDLAFTACYEDDVRAGGTLRGLYAGYQADPVLAFNDTATNIEQDTYHVRHRVYSTDLGRWARRDPIGYIDGMSVYQYVRSMTMIQADPSGLTGVFDVGFDCSCCANLCQGTIDCRCTGWVNIGVRFGWFFIGMDWRGSTSSLSFNAPWGQLSCGTCRAGCGTGSGSSSGGSLLDPAIACGVIRSGGLVIEGALYDMSSCRGCASLALNIDILPYLISGGVLGPATRTALDAMRQIGIDISAGVQGKCSACWCQDSNNNWVLDGGAAKCCFGVFGRAMIGMSRPERNNPMP
jgi:RHS repeat-associated protein